MTFISNTVFRPLPGKAATAHERIGRVAEIMTRAGARVRLARVAWGDGAGDIHLYGVFATMEAAGKAWTAGDADPDFAKLRSESEKDRASNWEGPEIWRCVFGEPQPGYPVILQREYDLDRRHLKSAIGLLPELQALQADRPLLAAVPAVSGDMARFMVAYYGTSLIDVGERMDRIGTSEAFQSIVVRAAEFGALTRARVLMNM